MKRRVFAAVILCLAGVGAAQPGPGQRGGTIIGRVFEVEQGTAVEYANVVLFSLPESVQVNGAVTDKSGGFRFDGLKPGRYRVEMSFIGYGSRTVKEVEVRAGEPCDLGRIGLELKPIAVPGVEAVGEKPAIRYEVDKKVVDVTKQPNASSGTAVDALRNVPSVKVDVQDNVTVRGSSNFKVLIDGKATQEEPSDALKQIPSATIQNIEIITNPSARYEPDGTAGIINVVLKKQKGRGTSALVNANAGPGDRYGGDALLGYKQGIVSLYAGGNLNRYVFNGDANAERRTYDALDTVATISVGSTHGGPFTGGLRAGLELQDGPMDKSSVSGRFRLFKTGGIDTNSVTEHYQPGDSCRHYTADGGWTWAGRTYFMLADHEHLFDTTGHKLVASASLGGRSAISTGRSEELDSIGDTTYGRLTDNDGLWHRLDAEVQYTRPRFGGGSLDAGYDGWWERTDARTNTDLYDRVTHRYVHDTISSRPYYGTECVHGAYATWSWSLKRLGVQPGLRVEYDSRLVKLTDTDSAYPMKRWDCFPGLHLSYSLPANQQVTTGYSRRIDRPTAWDLTPLATWYDAHTIGRGNPSLRPQYTDAYEGSYQLPFGASSLNAGVYYRVTHDLFEWVTATSDSTALLQTVRNVGSDRSLGVELSGTLSPLKWLTLSPSANLSDYWLLLEDQDSTGHSLAWSASLDLDVHLESATQFRLSGNYYAPTATSQGRQGGWFDTNIALKQSFLKRALSVTLRVSNLLGRGIWRSVSEGPGFYTASTWRAEPRVITLAASYNLNSFKLEPKMRAGEGIESEGAGGAGGGGGGGPQR